jgi:hypothetical protein
MPLRPRYEYAAVLPRSLPGSSCPPPREFPAHTLGECAPLPAQIHQVSSRCRIKGLSHAGSSRTPLRPACRTRTIWQFWPVPALSGLLPPSPASPGSGCPQLHRPAATGSAAKVSHLHSNHCASRRTHDLRHGAASLSLAAGNDLKVVQAMLGHSSIVLTADTYTSVLPCLAHQAAEATAAWCWRRLGMRRPRCAAGGAGNDAAEAKDATPARRPRTTADRRGLIRPHAGPTHDQSPPARSS